MLFLLFSLAFVREEFSFFKDFIYLFMRDTERERQRRRQREKQVPRREPDAGLDPMTPGSCPELEADTQLLSPTGVPGEDFSFHS